MDKSTQLPFYIGVGQGRRAYSTDRNQTWIDYVNRYAGKYEVEFIVKNVDKETAYYIENLFISKFGKVYNGKGCLLNWTDGGYMEGASVTLVFDDRDFLKHLTKFGKKLAQIDIEQLDWSHVSSFVNDMIVGDVNSHLEQLEKRLAKKYRISSISIPFCTSEKLSKRGRYSIHAISIEEFQEEINKPIDLEQLPHRPYVDFYTHRIGIYFEMIIQRSVWVENNGERISIYNPLWNFGGPDRFDYQKLLVSINQGKKFECSLDKKVKSEINYLYNFSLVALSD